MRVYIVRRRYSNGLQVIYQHRTSGPTISTTIVNTSLYDANFYNRECTVSNGHQINLNGRTFRRNNRLIYDVLIGHLNRSLQLNFKGRNRVKNTCTVRRNKARRLAIVNSNLNSRYRLRQHNHNITLTSKNRYRFINNKTKQRHQYNNYRQNTNILYTIGNSNTTRTGLNNRVTSLILPRDRTGLNRDNIQKPNGHILRQGLSIDTINLMRNIQRLNVNTEGHMQTAYKGLHVHLMVTNFRDNKYRSNLRQKTKQMRL